jgi:hypothetical protein
MHIVDWQSRPIEDVLNAEIERLAARVAELEEFTRWIPVSERLPENGQDVFCISKYGEGKARQFMDDGETQWWMHSDSIHCDELDFIVKWMPVIQEEG